MTEQHPFDELVEQILRSKLNLEQTPGTLERQTALFDDLIRVIIKHAAPVEAVNVLANLTCRAHACIGQVAGVDLEESCKNLHAVVDYLYPLVFSELKETSVLLRTKGNA